MTETHVESRGRTIQLGPLDTGSAQQLRPLFTSVLALTAIVLLLVCSNVANMLLVRGANRAAEIGVRFALGATRRRVLRLLMLENVILATGGVVVGLGLAVWGRTAFTRLLPPTTIPLDVQTRLDAPVLAFAAVVTAATVVVFGVLPALTASRVHIAGAVGGMLWPSGLLTVTALWAGCWAARRATRIDPARVLRAD